ncbi:protein EXORDIUM-like 2 [Gastrolobium bilobum]|uniref:protein EXORDIUM-like 2 n=1 Tax=Gastrolobium bilobum TaxID=150636 RepID=UPI002AB11E91|nr:protein EXORDIUM-like 2 [Gastrolobium bilobum]
MAFLHPFSFTLFVTSILFVLSNLPNSYEATPFNRMLALVQPEPIVLKDHKGPLLKGNVTVHVLWYGNFTPTQRSIIIDFIKSLSSAYHAPSPSVRSWWQTTARYRGGPCTLAVGKQILDDTYSLGKSLKTTQLVALASKTVTKTRGKEIRVVLTAADVAVEDFCMNQCGTHDSGRVEKSKAVYAWVGNPMAQCPGECAWPFHQPVYGPQTPPLVPPNGDVGVDGMLISLATVLAGTVTNPFKNGYYEGSAVAPLEAVSACTGIFGKGAYPGYPGNVLVDKTTGASYNAVGVKGRKFLLPAMWDPNTSTCKTLV